MMAFQYVPQSFIDRVSRVRVQQHSTRPQSLPISGRNKSNAWTQEEDVVLWHWPPYRANVESALKATFPHRTNEACQKRYSRSRQAVAKSESSQSDVSDIDYTKRRVRLDIKSGLHPVTTSQCVGGVARAFMYEEFPRQFQDWPGNDGQDNGSIVSFYRRGKKFCHIPAKLLNRSRGLEQAIITRIAPYVEQFWTR